MFKRFSDHLPLQAWVVFLLVVLADVLDLLSTTVTNVAAPTILQALHAPQSLAPWLGTSYTLAMGSVLIIGGRLGDRFGSRRLFLVGLAGFALGSLAVAAASSPLLVVASRVGQGLFGGLLIPQGFVLLMRVVPRTSMRVVFSLFGPLLATCSISGPVIAGLLIDADCPVAVPTCTDTRPAGGVAPPGGARRPRGATRRRPA